MKLVFSKNYCIDLGGHVFDARKYCLLAKKIIQEKLAKKSDFLEPKPASQNDLLLVHKKDWINKLEKGTLSFAEQMRLELPWSKKLWQWACLYTGGTILAVEEALKNGASANLAGGLHHAYSDHGEGFCPINDIAVAIRKTQQSFTYEVKKVPHFVSGKCQVEKFMVIDCDLHQGNGTAAIFEDDSSVFTFSIHQEDNYPIPKESSDLDIGLNSGLGDKEYLEALERNVPAIIKKFQPQLIIYVAGADPYEHDQLGGLELTTKGLKKRDEIVISEAKRNKISIVVTLAGGYSSLEGLVQIHFNTIKTLLLKK